MKKIISLHGSYFCNNYGDILLINIFNSWIKHEYPDCIINLPLANKNRINELPDGTVGLINLLRSKALVYCGGGYFGEPPKNKAKWARRNFFRHAIIGIIAIIFKIPYAIIGVEFGPISTNWFRKVCICIAKHAKVIVVRNESSKHYLESNGVEKVVASADAVLSLSSVVSVIHESNAISTILIHINMPNKLPDNYASVMSKLLNAIDKTFSRYKIFFISDGDGNYYNNEVCEEIFNSVLRRGVDFEVVKYDGYKKLIDIINHADYVITSKLHVGITAAALDKRVLSLWVHNKTPRLHNQIGNANNCIPFSDESNLESVAIDYFNSSFYKLPSKVYNDALINKTELLQFLKDIM